MWANSWAISFEANLKRFAFWLLRLSNSLSTFSIIFSISGHNHITPTIGLESITDFAGSQISKSFLFLLHKQERGLCRPGYLSHWSIQQTSAKAATLLSNVRHSWKTPAKSGDLSDAAHTIRTMTSASFTASALPGEESQSKATLGKRRHCYEQGRNGRHPSGSKCNTNNVKKSCHKIQLELHSTLFYRSTGVMTHRHVKLF